LSSESLPIGFIKISSRRSRRIDSDSREFSGRRQDTFDVSSGLGPFRREANVHAMTYREAIQTAAAALREVANPSDPLRNLVRIHPRTMPSVTEFDCSPHRRLLIPPTQIGIVPAKGRGPKRIPLRLKNLP